MNYRKLRIAWSILWGVFAVFLIAIWLRSYWRADSILWWASPNGRISRITIFDSYIEFNSQATGIGDHYEIRFAEPYHSAPVLFEPRHYGFVWKPRVVVVPLWLPFALAICCAVPSIIPWSRRFSFAHYSSPRR